MMPKRTLFMRRSLIGLWAGDERKMGLARVGTRSTAFHRVPIFIPERSGPSGIRSLPFRWLLAHDFLGLFVLAQAQEGGLAEVMVAGPFGETNLANQLRLQPRADTSSSPR